MFFYIFTNKLGCPFTCSIQCKTVTKKIKLHSKVFFFSPSSNPQYRPEENPPYLSIWFIVDFQVYHQIKKSQIYEELSCWIEKIIGESLLLPSKFHEKIEFHTTDLIFQHIHQVFSNIWYLNFKGRKTKKSLMHDPWLYRIILCAIPDKKGCFCKSIDILSIKFHILVKFVANLDHWVLGVQVYPPIVWGFKLKNITLKM